MKSNYEKYPTVNITGFNDECWLGWKDIIDAINIKLPLKDNKKTFLVVETYPGADENEILAALEKGLKIDKIFYSKSAFLSEKEIDELTYTDVTDDRIFGFMTKLDIDSFFDAKKLSSLKLEMEQAEGLVVILGTGASLLTSSIDLLIYADMARWEIQLRMRRQQISNLGVNNASLPFGLLYKRAYFVDWRVADRLKNKLMKNWDFVLDTNDPQLPKMISGNAHKNALEQVVQQPFRVVPFFDPGPWGGQWMKEVCDLDRQALNFAWCFDCVPEENSLLLSFGEHTIEIPSINLVFYQAKQLLGAQVYGQFGAEFPIRFDFLDTMDGGNLSLQVHPLTAYIKEKFGVNYTQDESYYILDAKDDACVYLGLKEDVSPELMIAELEEAQDKGTDFDAEKHVEKWPVKKHDHVLIPAGTIHCSGKNSMVLEISATPYIFTFKLWDWGRLGLDGLPRPINIVHGKNNILWHRRQTWVKDNLLNRVSILNEGDGWREERTGLHETEFIETRRHWFNKKTKHHTQGNLNVLNLIQGREVLVESPSNAFKPITIHYAETFIVPAIVGEYTIRPFGESEGQECATIKAYVRIST